jgi:1-acyl-sn-glycerol-3-phosphate acyltransferase
MSLDAADRILRAAHAVAGLAARYHQAELQGVERLPTHGPALLVGNHGLFGLETLAFFWLLHDRTGRLPKGLADRVVFGNRFTRPLLERVGGHVGTRASALQLLRQGHLVVCYPGGAREVFKAPGDHYRLRWDRAVGFARVAIEAGVPVVPFAGLGVDESFVNLGHLDAARGLLGRYAPPLALGPFPTRFRFVLGEPILPPEDPAEAPLLKSAVEQAVVQLLETKGAHAVPAEPARVVS